jgi:4-phospho-D-threonate 3-dehydrogenase / 4-phospho-D-erythronate 3-dehydrogenase
MLSRNGRRGSNIRLGRPSILLGVSVRTHESPVGDGNPGAGGIPVVAVSLGDPGGIGPEIVCKALSDKALRSSARWRILGVRDPVGWTLPPDVVVKSVAEADVFGGVAAPPGAAGSITFVDVGVTKPGEAAGCARFAALWPPLANARAGDVSFRCVERAIELAMRAPGDPWRADAVVTGPINKESWALAGHGQFPGHTELLAARCQADRFAMMFHAPPSDDADQRGDRLAAGLNVILATTHCPLREVATRLTTARVLEAIELGAAAMRRLGVSNPRLGVCGLNPHAGEHGLLGHEDQSIIEPAVVAARAKGIDAKGPLPADTIFQGALSFKDQRPAKFDLVVAMYHDQGLIPLKTIAWDRAVNITVGLPIVRTSPDHGTAFDIAGKNIADAGSMRAAMRLAVEMARTE